MKKAKIMLTAITMLAIVGGALAFKVKKFAIDYCTSAVATISCPNFIPMSHIKPGVPKVYYTIDDGSQCQDKQPCPLSGNIGPE
jgi:hypothetical protein